MAKLITSILAISIFIAFLATPCVHADEEHWFQSICAGSETSAKIHFYVQDRLAGPNVTVYEVARATITSDSTTSFGQIRVLDNLLTAKPSLTSKVVGRVQGLITSSDLDAAAFATNLNFYFTSGKYNGSTISILGRNEIMQTERELPIVGGTGVFRMARGYALTSTYSYDVETQHGVLEYTLYFNYTAVTKSVPVNQHPSM